MVTIDGVGRSGGPSKASQLPARLSRFLIIRPMAVVRKIADHLARAILDAALDQRGFGDRDEQANADAYGDHQRKVSETSASCQRRKQPYCVRVVGQFQDSFSFTVSDAKQEAP